jgi:hypothetical protein
MATVASPVIHNPIDTAVAEMRQLAVPDIEAGAHQVDRARFAV